MYVGGGGGAPESIAASQSTYVETGIGWRHLGGLRICRQYCVAHSAVGREGLKPLYCRRSTGSRSCLTILDLSAREGEGRKIFFGFLVVIVVEE